MEECSDKVREVHAADEVHFELPVPSGSELHSSNRHHACPHFRSKARPPGGHVVPLCLFITARQDLLLSTSCHSKQALVRIIYLRRCGWHLRISVACHGRRAVKLSQIGIRRIRPLRLKTRGAVEASEMPDERHWMLRQCSDDELWKAVLCKLSQGCTDGQGWRYLVGF